MANNIIKRIWNQNKMVQIEDLKGMAFQAEDGGHTFEIYGIDEAGETVTLTGTPSGVFLRPDNTDVVLDCSVSDGVVSATLPDECYDVPGRGGLTVFITADGKKTALYAAVVTVSRTSSWNVAPPATQTVVDLINAISAAVATIPASYSALMADIAPTYSDSALYAVGQYAWYDGDLKRCIVPITTAESYTAAHWTSAVLGNDVSDLKSALALTNSDVIALNNSVYKTLASGEQSQSPKSYSNNAIVLGTSMTSGHKYRIFMQFVNFTNTELNRLTAVYVATGTSSGDRVTDIKTLMDFTKPNWISEGNWFDYTATAAITHICPQYNSSYSPESNFKIKYIVLDMDVYAFADKETETQVGKNTSAIETINNELYNTISSGNKTQGGNYAANAISLGDTMKAGKTYNISLRFNGSVATYLQYLTLIYTATGTGSNKRLDDGSVLFNLIAAIEYPFKADKWYTIEYTPSADTTYICPAYSSSYSPSDSNSIDYKVVEKYSRIDQIEDQLGRDELYNFTPVNTWEENAVPSAISQKLNAMENDILGVFQGDSLTALIEYSGAQTEPEHCPPGMQYKSWTYWLWENMARVKPLCDRLDSQRSGNDFFTKTGTWEQVDGTKFDNSPTYCKDYQTERSVACLTYQSASSNAAVSFTFDADTYEKCNIVFELKPDGADCEIAITQGNGKMLVSLDRSTWVEANGFTHTQQSNPDGLSDSQIKESGLAIQQRHRRLWMKKASGVTGNITITYKRSSTQTLVSPYMYCWGVERWSGNTVFIDNAGRGGRYTTYLSWNISDIFDRHPDFAMFEMPLANETDEGLSNIYGFYEQYFTGSDNNSYKTRSENYTKVPLIVILPHGRGVFFNNDNAAIFDSDHQVVGDPPAYVIYMTIFNWLKGQLSSYTNVSVDNLYCRMLNEATGIGQPINAVFGSNGDYAFTQDTVHLNARGARMYCKYLLPLFQR